MIEFCPHRNVLGYCEVCNEERVLLATKGRLRSGRGFHALFNAMAKRTFSHLPDFLKEPISEEGFKREYPLTLDEAFKKD